MVTDVAAHARRAARVGAFATLTASMLAVYRTHDRLTPEGDRLALRQRYLRRWSAALLSIFGVEVVVLGNVPPRTTRGRLIVANHRSTIDIGLLLREFGGQLVSRDDLATWPLVGAAARSVETVFVDRENATSGVQAIRAMARFLQIGRLVSVFPEGTTFPDDEVRPFHKGAFVAAKMADAEILPVGIAYQAAEEAAYVDETFAQHLARLAGARTTRVAMAIGETMRIEQNAERTARAARDRVAELVAKARAAVR